MRPRGRLGLGDRSLRRRNIHHRRLVFQVARANHFADARTALNYCAIRAMHAAGAPSCCKWRCAPNHSRQLRATQHAPKSIFGTVRKAPIQKGPPGPLAVTPRELVITEALPVSIAWVPREKHANQSAEHPASAPRVSTTAPGFPKQ
jgi:hypothetical protein